MALSKISSKMVTNPVNQKSSLNDYFENKVEYSICEFGYNGKNLDLSIEKGLKFLRRRGYGTLQVPPISEFSNYVSYIDAIKEGSVVNIRFRHSNYRQPVGSRPFGGNYEVGDIVYNSDITRSNYMGWVCIDSGSPGTWKPFGRIEL